MLLYYILRTLPVISFATNSCINKVLSSLNQSNFTLIFMTKSVRVHNLFNYSTVEIINDEYYKPPDNQPIDSVKAEQMVIFGDKLSEKWLNHPKWNSRARTLIIFENNLSCQSVLETINKETVFVNLGLLKFYNNIATYLKVKKIGCSLSAYVDPSCDATPEIGIKKDVEILKSCSLKVGVNMIHPYSFNNSKGELVEGLDYQYVKILTEYYGFQVEWISLDEPAVNKTQSSNVWLELLGSRQVDLVFGVMSLNEEELRLVDSIDHFYDEEIDFWAPTPDLKPSWSEIYFVFDNHLWIIIAVAFLVVCVIFWVSYPELSIFQWVYITWGLTFSGNFRQPQTLTVKTLLIAYLLHLVMMSSIYQSALIKYRKSIHYGLQFKHPWDAAKSGLTLYYSQEYERFFNKIDKRLFKNSTCVTKFNFTSVFKKIVADKSGFMLTARRPIEYHLLTYGIAPSGCKLLYKMGQLIPVKAVIYVFKNHPFLEELQRKTKEIFEGGFVKVWANNINYKAKRGKSGLSLLNTEKEGVRNPRPLKLDDLRLLIFFYTGSLILAFTTFIIECWLSPE